MLTESLLKLATKIKSLAHYAKGTLKKSLLSQLLRSVFKLED